MQYVFTVCDEIQKSLDYQCSCILDAKLPCGSSVRRSEDLPAVLINDSALIVFIEFEDCRDACFESLKTRFRNVLNTLCAKMELSINSFLLYGYNREDLSANIPAGFCAFNIYNDRIKYFDCEQEPKEIADIILDEMSFRKSVFDEKQIDELSFRFELLSGSNGDVKKGSDGAWYVKKHGKWYQCSELDSDELFQKAALFGMFGAHKFIDGKKGSGILYFLTGGMLGIGWLYDCLLIFFGMYRDSEGKYLAPLSERKGSIVSILIGLLIAVVYILLIVFVFKGISSVLGFVLEGALPKGENLPSNIWPSE